MTIQAWGRSLMWFFLGGLICGLAWFAVRGAGARSEMTVRSYEVRPEIAEEMVGALQGALLGNTEEPLGRVSLAPDRRRLIVSTTPSLQKGAAAVISEIAASKPESTPSTRFEVWLITTASGAGAGRSALTEIEPALATIEKAAGPMNFQLLEKLSTVSRAGHEESSVSGVVGIMSVRSSIRRAENDATVVAAEIQIQVVTQNGRRTALKALTEIAPGELLVIGQSDFASGSSSPGPAQIYYVVRATP